MGVACTRLQFSVKLSKLCLSFLPCTVAMLPIDVYSSKYGQFLFSMRKPYHQGYIIIIIVRKRNF